MVEGKISFSKNESRFCEQMKLLMITFWAKLL